MNHSSTFLIASLLALSPTLGLANPYPAENAPMTQRLEQVRAVSPALEQFTLGPVLGELWKRPQLSPRDRSLITITCLVALGRDQAQGHMEYGIENGLTVEEIGEAIAHIAFYAGWPVAGSAARKLKTIVDARDAAQGKE